MKFNSFAAGAALVAGMTCLALTPAQAGSLVPTGLWDVQDQFMNDGDFFTGTYTAIADETVRVTDLYVTGDSFGVYVNGAFQFNTPSVPAGVAADYTSDADTAFASSAFSHAIFKVAGGDVISFTDLSIPPGYDDGTIAVSAVTGVPEPLTWALMLTGFVGVGASLRMNRQRSAATA